MSYRSGRNSDENNTVRRYRGDSKNVYCYFRRSFIGWETWKTTAYCWCNMRDTRPVNHNMHSQWSIAAEASRCQQSRHDPASAPGASSARMSLEDHRASAGSCDGGPAARLMSSDRLAPLQCCYYYYYYYYNCNYYSQCLWCLRTDDTRQTPPSTASSLMT